MKTTRYRDMNSGPPVSCLRTDHIPDMERKFRMETSSLSFVFSNAFGQVHNSLCPTTLVRAFANRYN